MTQFSGHEKTEDAERVTRWYQEPWSLYIVGILAVTFIWGTFQVIVSFRHADEVVVDDYYKVGKAINQDLSRDKRAAELGIQAQLETRSQGRLQVTLSGKPDHWPAQLRLYLIPASPGQEKQTVALLQSPARPQVYTGQTRQDFPAGRYYLQLETLDVMTPEKGFLSGWRLNHEIHYQPGTVVRLGSYE